jgi:hypothetical protein
MIKTWIEKLKTLRLYFVRKRCFEVYFTDNKSGKEGKINVWVKDVDEVKPYFEKHFPLVIICLIIWQKPMSMKH